MIVTYQLLKEKSPNQTSGFRKPFPASFALPAISRVHFQDDKGKTIVRKVRYCPMEDSIFMDKQPKDAKVEKIVFFNGRLDVNTLDAPQMYEIMELLDANGGKVNRNPTRKAIYTKYDASAKARVRLESQKENAVKMRTFWTMSDDELEGIAGLWGIKTVGKTKPIWKDELFETSRANPDKFIQLSNDENLGVVIDINRARKFSLIEYVNRRWMYGSIKLLDVSIGGNPHTELIKFLKLNPATQEAIQKECEFYENKLKGESVVEKTVDVYSAEEVLEMGTKSGVVVYGKGKGWKFAEHYDKMSDGDEQYFGSNEGSRNRRPIAVEFIANNDDVKKEILVRRELKMKSEASS